MLKFKLVFISVLLAFPVTLLTYSQEIPSGRRLRDIVEEAFPEGNFLLGGTTGAWTFGQQTSIIMDREFNYVTPENDFKQWNIHPDNSSGFNWAQTDAWLAHIRDNDQILRMHCPIGPQCSSWAQNDSRTDVELSTNLVDFMTAVCQRYNDSARVFSLDVVNEVVKNGVWHEPLAGIGSWENPWTIIGYDTDPNATPLYIKMAFEIANEHAPDLVKVFNHHEHPEVTASWDLIKETIQYLRDSSLQVDAIGWQAHVDNGWATTDHLNKLRDLIDWAHNNDLEFHVTEASVWIYNEPTSAELTLQAETYRKILEVCIEKSANGVVGWNTWHIDDATGWNTDRYPSLFDADGIAKPAYYYVQDLLESYTTTGINDGYTDFTEKFRVYPNPVNSESELYFNLTENTDIKVEIFNVTGQLIKVITDRQYSAGAYSIPLNLEDNDSQDLYFVRITSGNKTNTIKLVSGF